MPSTFMRPAEGHVLVGVLSKNYPDIPSAVADMQAYAKLHRQRPLHRAGSR